MGVTEKKDQSLVKFVLNNVFVNIK